MSYGFFKKYFLSILFIGLALGQAALFLMLPHEVMADGAVTLISQDKIAHGMAIPSGTGAMAEATARANRILYGNEGNIGTGPFYDYGQPINVIEMPDGSFATFWWEDSLLAKLASDRGFTELPVIKYKPSDPIVLTDAQFDSLQKAGAATLAEKNGYAWPPKTAGDFQKAMIATKKGYPPKLGVVNLPSGFPDVPKNPSVRPIDMGVLNGKLPPEIDLCVTPAAYDADAVAQRISADIGRGKSLKLYFEYQQVRGSYHKTAVLVGTSAGGTPKQSAGLLTLEVVKDSSGVLKFLNNPFMPDSFSPQVQQILKNNPAAVGPIADAKARFVGSVDKINTENRLQNAFTEIQSKLNNPQTIKSVVCPPKVKPVPPAPKPQPAAPKPEPFAPGPRPGASPLFGGANSIFDNPRDPFGVGLGVGPRQPVPPPAGNGLTVISAEPPARVCDTDSASKVQLELNNAIGDGQKLINELDKRLGELDADIKNAPTAKERGSLRAERKALDAVRSNAAVDLETIKTLSTASNKAQAISLEIREIDVTHTLLSESIQEMNNAAEEVLKTTTADSFEYKAFKNRFDKAIEEIGQNLKILNHERAALVDAGKTLRECYGAPFEEPESPKEPVAPIDIPEPREGQVLSGKHCRGVSGYNEGLDLFDKGKIETSSLSKRFPLTDIKPIELVELIDTNRFNIKFHSNGALVIDKVTGAEVAFLSEGNLDEIVKVANGAEVRVTKYDCSLPAKSPEPAAGSGAAGGTGSQPPVQPPVVSGEPSVVSSGAGGGAQACDPNAVAAVEADLKKIGEQLRAAVNNGKADDARVLLKQFEAKANQLAAVQYPGGAPSCGLSAFERALLKLKLTPAEYSGIIGGAAIGFGISVALNGPEEAIKRAPIEVPLNLGIGYVLTRAAALGGLPAFLGGATMVVGAAAGGLEVGTFIYNDFLAQEQEQAAFISGVAQNFLDNKGQGGNVNDFIAKNYPQGITAADPWINDPYLKLAFAKRLAALQHERLISPSEGLPAFSQIAHLYPSVDGRPDGSGSVLNSVLEQARTDRARAYRPVVEKSMLASAAKLADLSPSEFSKRLDSLDGLLKADAKDPAGAQLSKLLEDAGFKNLISGPPGKPTSSDVMWYRAMLSQLRDRMKAIKQQKDAQQVACPAQKPACEPATSRSILDEIGKIFEAPAVPAQAPVYSMAVSKPNYVLTLSAGGGAYNDCRVTLPGGTVIKVGKVIGDLRLPVYLSPGLRLAVLGVTIACNEGTAQFSNFTQSVASAPVQVSVPFRPSPTPPVPSLAPPVTVPQGEGPILDSGTPTPAPTSPLPTNTPPPVYTAPDLGGPGVIYTQ